MMYIYIWASFYAVDAHRAKKGFTIDLQQNRALEQTFNCKRNLKYKDACSQNILFNKYKKEKLAR